jgi:hypothetical protein
LAGRRSGEGFVRRKDGALSSAGFFEEFDAGIDPGSARAV